jgi:hypothetical protein
MRSMARCSHLGGLRIPTLASSLDPRYLVVSGGFGRQEDRPINATFGK